MYYQTVTCILLCLSLVQTAHLPEVRENEESKDSFVPSVFNFQEYKKMTQLDPQRMRYQQQQTADSKIVPKTVRQDKYLQQDEPDQNSAYSQDVSVKVPPQSSWKVIHPKFVNEKPQERMPSQSHQRSREDFDKPQPTEKARITKKSLPNNSYQVTENEDINGKQDRQDNNIGPHNYLFQTDVDLGTKAPKVLQQNLGGFVGNHQEKQLQALSSLLGQNPNVQLQGLQHLLNNKPVFPLKDHTPIQEDIVDIPNTQNKPNIKVDHIPEHMLKALQAISKQGGNNDQHALKTLQAQLDATASAHAEKIIAQAQQQALEQVKAQHAAIARAQAEAENAALAQIQVQNEALARAHADNEARRQAESRRHAHEEAEARRQSELKEVQELAQKEKEEREVLEEKRRFNDRRRQEELARERARVASLQQKLKKEREQANIQTKDDGYHKNKKNTHVSQDISETQNHYFTHQAPQHLQETHKPQIIPQASKPTYTYAKTKDQVEADVSKYYSPPQITLHEGKNSHGEHEVQYAAKYAFGYRIRDYHVGNDFGHEESKDGETTKGRYHVLLPDGRVQNVEYYADPTGYHAKVSYAGSTEEH